MKVLHHKIYGQGGNIVYILHGIFGMLDNWHNIATQMPGYTVVSCDARNHGKSFHSDTMGFEDMAMDVKDLCQHLGHNRISLMGHSMGGKTAMKFSEMYPEMLESLIVVDIAPKAYEPGHHSYFEAFEKIDFSQMKSRSETENALLAYAPELTIRQFLLKNLEPMPSGGYRPKLNLQGIKKNYEEIINIPHLKHPSFSGRTLFISGEKSRYVLPEDKEEILMAFPNAQFLIISKAGHWVHADNASEFLQKLKEFLD